MRMLRRTAALAGALLMTQLGAARAEGDFYLKDGDRVVFYGDSITAQRLYTTYAETFAVTRFPQRKFTFVHSGWGGDRVSGGGGGPIDQRLDRDVLAYKPTVVTSMLGMNDGSYRAFDQAIFDVYAKGYQHIVEKLKKDAPGVRLTLIVPSPFDDVTRPPAFEGGYNAVLVRYGKYLEELADKENLDIADLNTGVVAAMQKAEQTNHDRAVAISPDRVHPAPAGHLLMAAELLKAWDAPATVSAVEIDAAAGKLTTAENTKIADLTTTGNVTWTQTDGALPMPVNMADAITALAVNSSDFVAKLNQQPLKVTGLAAEKYLLKIDGVSLGSFTKEQLAEGINLATLPTPMAKQAAKVHELTISHNNIHDTRFHTVQLGMQGYKLPATVEASAALAKALDAEEAEVIIKQRAAAQPLPRKYELLAQ